MSWWGKKESKPSAPPAQPKPSAPPAPSAPAAPSAPPAQRAPSISSSASGGDLFAGLTRKQATGPPAPTHAPAPSAPPVSPQPSAPVAHHASSPFNPASVSAPPAASANSFSMFSGLSVKPSAAGAPPLAPTKNPTPPAGLPPGFPSSGMPPTDRSSPAPPAGLHLAENGANPNRSAAAASPFAFIDQDAGEGNDAPAADGDGSAFDFLGGGGGDDQPDQKEQVPGAGGLLDFSGMSVRAPHGGPLPGSARADNSDAVSVVSDATTSTHRSSIVHGAGLSASLGVKGGEMDHKPIDVDSDGEEHVGDEAAAERQRALREQQLNTRLATIRKTLDDALVVHWLAVKHAQEQELGMRDHEKSCLASLKECEDQLKETEAQQIAAIEAEEYEKADQLNDTIEKIKRKISGVQVSMKQSSAKHAQIQDQRAVSLQSLLRSVKECTETLNQIQQIQEQTLETHVTKQTASLNEAEDKLNAQFDRVDRVLAHVADDLKHAVEEEQTVEESIRAQTQDVEAEKAALLDKEKTLMEEYEELARKLREKEQELRVCRTQLDEVGAKITSTRTKHERKIKRIQEKKDRILAEQKSAQREHSVLEAQRSQLDARSERVHAKTAELTELIKTIKFEVKGTSFLMERLQEDEARQKEWRSADQKIQEDTRALADQLAATIKEIETGRAALVEIEQETTKQREIIAQSDSDVPRLENEKKMAVTAKNFKKAAQASADIKTCTANKEAAIAKISELGAQGSKTEEDVRVASARKAELQDKLNKAEYDTDLRRIKTLLERLYTSEALLESVESLLPSLLSAGAQSKDRPSASLEAEADALRYETSALQREVKELRAKHKWAEDFPHVQRPKPSQVARHLVPQEEKEEEDDAPLEQPKRGSQKTKEAQPAAKNHKASADDEDESQPGEGGEEKAPSAPSAPAAFDPVKQRKDRQALLQKVSELEGKLDLAIANEAFDEAEQLQADIDASKRKITDIENELTSRELSLTDPEPEPVAPVAEPAPVEEKAAEEPESAEQSEPAVDEAAPALAPAAVTDDIAGGGDDENEPSAFDFTQSENN